jgi:predicted XRE-type DNA-binding protein
MSPLAEAVYVLHAFAKESPTHFAARLGAGTSAHARSDAEVSTMKEQRFDSVWDAIEASPVEAANLKARAEMMIAIREVIDMWGVTQAAAAKRLGLTQPRMNDLIRGRINKFSLDALINLAARAGLTVRVEVDRPAA